MKTLIKEVENLIRAKEENIRYQKDELNRVETRLKDEMDTLDELKKDLAHIKSAGHIY